MYKRFVLIHRALVIIFVLMAVPSLADISGYSTVSNCGEAGNWLEITFTSSEPVTLSDVRWDFNTTNVWLDPSGTSLCGTINEGVTSVAFYLDGPEGQPTQVFGITATGFDSGDRYRFSRDLDFGSDGSPFTFHYYGGTVTAEFSDGTILVGTFDTPYNEPNGARAFLEESGPNLMFFDFPGWYAPVVPRPDDTATWSSVPGPSILVGESASTWFNAACYNGGTATALPSNMIIRLDGHTVCNHNLWAIAPGSYNGWVDDGPLTVRGGRHTVVAYCDNNDNIPESDETDNVYGRQWIWEPMTLPLHQVVTRSAPPAHDAGIEFLPDYWWNCDGVRIEPGNDRPWNAVWMEPVYSTPVDYFMRLHPQATGPEDGFGSSLEATMQSDGLDAFLVNTRNATAPAYDVGIINIDQSNTGADYRILHLENSPYPFDFGIFPETPYFSSRLMTFEFFSSIFSLGPASLVIETDPEDGPVNLGWLPPDFEVGILDDVQDVVSTGERGWAVLNLDLTQIGHNCAVVWCDRFEHPGNLSVRVGLFHGRPDLQPVTLTGWHAPVVPQPEDDSALFSCSEPDTLMGNLPHTWLNTACMNGGSADADTVSFLLSLDGETLVGIRNHWTPLPPGHPRTVTNNWNPIDQEPWTIPGGRHTLSTKLDYFQDVAELLENNNLTGRQYCWSPLVLPLGGVIDRSSVPAQDAGFDHCEPTVTLYPNCDGLRLQYADLGEVGKWRAAAVMPLFSSRNVDLELHQPLTGTSNGFGPNPEADSRSGPGEVDFALVCYRNAPPLSYDFGVLDGPGNNGHGYTVQDALSDYQGTPQGGSLGPFTILPGRMIELHEMWLSAGEFDLRVEDMGSDVEWGVSVYRANDSFFGKTETVEGGLGGSEWIHLNLPADDHYCVAVWKEQVADLAVSAPYRLLLAYGETSAPDVVPTLTRFLGAAPNPFNPQTVISYQLAAAGHCELVIHDLQGRAVRQLVSSEQEAGRHEVVFDGCDDEGQHLASGVYLAQLVVGGGRQLQKLTLIK